MVLRQPGRRRFIKYAAMLGVARQALLRSRDLSAAVEQAKDAVADAPWPAMTYRTLGRTGFEASRLVFGCGAALSKQRADHLLNTAFEAGVNVFDVGFRDYYDDAEQNLAPFLKQHRDQVFLISKAIVLPDLEPDQAVGVAEARQAAAQWLKRLDASLRELEVDRVDAYYLMASFNPSLVGSEEVHAAFLKAKAAGKVSHLGLSTHRNAQRVLETAIDSGFYSVAMIAITPGGWYDWANKSILEGSPPMAELQPLLARARAAGIGLIGMKAGRFLAGRRYFGWSNPDAFNEYYDPRLLNARLSSFQRSYAFVLAHGLDCVNADMQQYAQLKQNYIAAATSQQYFA